MKKAFGLLLMGLGLMALTPATTFAAPHLTTITGFVTDSNDRVDNAKVDVICHSDSMPTSNNTAFTKPSGVYVVHVLASFCPAGNTIYVTAKKDGKSGSASGTGSEVTRINVNLGGSTVILPEMSTVAGVTALSLAGGLLILVRRKQRINNLQ